MSSISNYQEDAILDHVYNQVSFTMPTQTWVGLYTSAVNDDASGAEVVGGAYSRVRMYPNGGTQPYWSLSASGIITNVQAIVYATATAAWGAITHVGMLDAQTVGNLLDWGALTTPVNIGIGGQFTFQPGVLQVQRQ